MKERCAVRFPCRLAHLLAALLAVSVPAYAATKPRVTSIEIDSRWGGLGEPEKFQMEVLSDGGRYRSANGFVDQSKVDALVSALRSLTLAKPDLSNLGLTRGWLIAHSLDSEDVRRKAKNAAPNQLSLYRQAFTDKNSLVKVVTTLLSSFHTDDYPGVSLKVEFDDGSAIVACAGGQHPFMLPWRISNRCIPGQWGRVGVINCNADISRAVAALMPTTAANQPRLEGADMGSELSDAVMDSIETEWNTLDAENRAGPTLATLRRRFHIVSAEINPYHHPEYGTKWDDKKPYAEAEREAQINLHVDLVSSRLPANVHIALVLPMERGKVEGVDEFLAAADANVLTLLSVPWLADFIRTHPRWPMMISYVGDASMGPKAMTTFAHEMHALGKDSLVSQVERVRRQAVLLMVGNEYYATYWIILPDHRVVLWRYDGSRYALLKWRPSDFRRRDCSDYQDAADGSGCVGTVVSADGQRTN